MKPSIDIFQVFKKQAVFTKSDYNAANRDAFSNWQKEVNSFLGYLDEDKLYLPTEKSNDIQPRSTGAVIIQDIIGYDGFQERKRLESMKSPAWYIESRLSAQEELLAFDAQKKVWLFGLFSIQRIADDQFEISLKYAANDMRIGIPGRTDHKFAVLKKGQPIRFVINGKSDFTMSGRKERTFSEFDYIIEYLGKASEIEFLARNKINKLKQIPDSFSNHIDERKMLV